MLVYQKFNVLSHIVSSRPPWNTFETLSQEANTDGQLRWLSSGKRSSPVWWKVLAVYESDNISSIPRTCSGRKPTAEGCFLTYIPPPSSVCLSLCHTHSLISNFFFKKERRLVPSNQEAEVALWVQSQTNLHVVFQASQSHIVRPCLQNKTKARGKEKQNSTPPALFRERLLRLILEPLITTVTARL